MHALSIAPISFRFLRRSSKETRFHSIANNDEDEISRFDLSCFKTGWLYNISGCESRRKNVRLGGKMDTPFLYASEIEFSLFQLASELIKSRAHWVFPREIPKFPKLRRFLRRRGLSRRNLWRTFTTEVNGESKKKRIKSPFFFFFVFFFRATR